MIKAVFLDRDGVINKERGYITDFKDIEIISGVPEAIRLLNKEGFKVIVVTNQPQIARGLSTEESIKSLPNKLSEKLIENGARIHGFYFCPHHPEKNHPDIHESVRHYRIDYDCRKPGT